MGCIIGNLLLLGTSKDGKKNTMYQNIKHNSFIITRVWNPGCTMIEPEKGEEKKSDVESDVKYHSLT